MADELDELRKRRMQEYAASQQNAALQEQISMQQQAQALQSQIKAIMPNILTPEARERISNIRAAKPDFAMQIELYLIQLFQSGQIRKPMTDAELRNILDKLVQKKETTIVRR